MTRINEAGVRTQKNSRTLKESKKEHQTKQKKQREKERKIHKKSIESMVRKWAVLHGIHTQQQSTCKADNMA